MMEDGDLSNPFGSAPQAERMTPLVAGLYNSSHGVSFSAGPQVQLPAELRV
jgi:hypothetical protein